MDLKLVFGLDLDHEATSGLDSILDIPEVSARPIFIEIFHPYSQHANMEVEEDVERVARWLGSIVPPACLKAFYHKQSVSTIIRLLRKTLSPISHLAPPVATHIHICSALGATCVDFPRWVAHHEDRLEHRALMLRHISFLC